MSNLHSESRFSAQENYGNRGLIDENEVLSSGAYFERS